MKVVVFGADTDVGRETVTDLVFRGHRVSAVLTDPAQAPAEWADRVHLRVGDPLDAAVIDTAVADNEVVIDVLCAARSRRLGRSEHLPRVESTTTGRLLSFPPGKGGEPAAAPRT